MTNRKIQGGILGVSHTPPNFDVPSNACDCHVHVFGLEFPYAPVRAYTPAPATLDDLKALHAALHIERVVIVHSSVYGADNSCTVDAVRKLKGRARGVAVIDKATTDAVLADMHEAGIRGVRINLGAIGESDPAVARLYLEEAAARVAPLGWHVQAYGALPVFVGLARYDCGLAGDIGHRPFRLRRCRARTANSRGWTRFTICCVRQDLRQDFRRLSLVETARLSRHRASGTRFDRGERGSDFMGHRLAASRRRAGQAERTDFSAIEPFIAG